MVEKEGDENVGWTHSDVRGVRGTHEELVLCIETVAVFMFSLTPVTTERRKKRTKEEQKKTRKEVINLESFPVSISEILMHIPHSLRIRSIYKVSRCHPGNGFLSGLEMCDVTIVMFLQKDILYVDV